MIFQPISSPALVIHAVDRSDYGDARALAEPPSLPDASTRTPLTSTPTTSTAMSTRPTTLNVDDFLVMKASTECK